MSYTTFTEEQIRGFRAASAEKHDGRVIQLDISEPIATTIVVAPFNRAEYAAHYDKKSRDPQTAFRGAMTSQLLWPGLVEIEALRQEWAMLPQRVADGLLVEAGVTDETAIAQPLDPKAPPRGMSEAEAAKMIADRPKARLWSVEHVELGISCVMEAPPADTLISAVSLYGDAVAKHKGIVDAISPWILGAVVWTAAPLEGGSGLLDRKPVAIWELWGAYRRMGGAGATTRRKSL